MAKEKEKYLTLKGLVKYNHDVLFPFMEETFATKKDLEGLATKKDIEKIASKEDIKNLSKQISALSDDLKKNNNLESRVDYIENILAIKK